MTVSTATPEGSIFKRSLVRIGMAVVAAGIAKFTIPRHRFPGYSLVTSGATGRGMSPSERIRRFAVIEQLRGLPSVLRMTTGAFAAELAFVGVLMTLRAFAPHPEESLVLILYANLRRLHFDSSRIVAALARVRSVFPNQLKARHLCVVEALLIKLCELESLTVMFVVAACTVQLIVGCFINSGMVTGPSVESS